MFEDKPARWLAIWPNATTDKRLDWELPVFGAVQNGDFFHYGGRTYMPFGDKDKVIKDYGEMTIDEWDAKGGDDQWYDDFPPVSSPADDYSQEVESWISPDGVIYFCHNANHEILAKRLCRKFGIVDSESFLTRHGDLLEKRGWIKLYWDKFLGESDDLSQRQLDALFDIFITLERRGDAKYLRDSIRKTLGIKSKVNDSEVSTPG